MNQHTHRTLSLLNSGPFNLLLSARAYFLWFHFLLLPTSQTYYSLTCLIFFRLSREPLFLDMVSPWNLGGSEHPPTRMPHSPSCEKPGDEESRLGMKGWIPLPVRHFGFSRDLFVFNNIVNLHFFHKIFIICYEYWH